MKKMLIGAVALFILIACDSPEKASENFLVAIQQKDFEKAREYTTENSEAFLQVLEQHASAQAVNHHFDIVHCAPREEGGDVVTCIYRVKSIDGQEFEKDLDLVNVKGKWLVSLE